MSQNIVVLLRSDSGRELVRRTCRDAGIDMTVIEELVEAQVNQIGKATAHGLYPEFDRIFDEVVAGEID